MTRTGARTHLYPLASRAAILAGCLVFYGLERLAVLASTTHLLFAVDRAEYGFLPVAERYTPVPLFRLLLDAPTRFTFLQDCLSVADHPHGTLGFTGLLAVLAVRFGAPLSTFTLKGVALGVSTTALGLWGIGILRSVPGRRGIAALIAFATAWTFAPPVFLKISLVCWGTHEMAVLGEALLAALFLPWVSGTDRPAENLVHCAILGVATGFAGAFSATLLLPAVFLGGWVAAAAALRSRGWKLRAGVGLACLGIGIAMVALTLEVILRTGVLRGLGMAGSMLDPGFLSPGPRPGSYFLGHTAAWTRLASWREKIWPFAFLLSPGRLYAARDVGLESLSRAALFGVALSLPLRLLFRRIRETPGAVQAAFAGSFLCFGWVVTSLICLQSAIYGAGSEGASPQYYALLYPAAFAALALGATTGGAAWRLPVLAAFLALWVQDHAEHMDLRNLGAWTRYDAAPLTLSGPCRLGPMNDATRAGYAFLSRYQERHYWRYLVPREVRDQPLQDRLLPWLATIPESTRSDPDFQVGLGRALSVLVPPSDVDRVREALSAAPMDDLWRGYGAP